MCAVSKWTLAYSFGQGCELARTAPLISTSRRIGIMTVQAHSFKVPCSNVPFAARLRCSRLEVQVPARHGCHPSAANSLTRGRFSRTPFARRKHHLMASTDCCTNPTPCAWPFRSAARLGIAKRHGVFGGGFSKATWRLFLADVSNG